MLWRGCAQAWGRRGLTTLLCPDGASASALEAQLRPLLPAPAAALLDDGLLRRLQVDGKSRLCMQQETRALLSSVANDAERHEVAVAMALISRKISMLLKGHCETCMYNPTRCMCDVVTPVRSRHTLWLFQNVGECGRANNSGRLLCLALGARLTTQGLRDEVDDMTRHAEAHRDSAVVLFPAPDAITIDDYMRQRAERLGQDPANMPALTIFLPDGTSNQAKNLERHLPAFLPRIRLNVSAMRSWLDPIRKQTEDHRVCTAQAAAAVLGELGERHVMSHVEQIVHLFVKRTQRDRAAPSAREAAQI